MLAIVNATIVLRDHLIPDGVILIDGDRIADFGEKLSVPDGAEVIDACGDYVGPGLIDIHTHAQDRTWFYEDPEKAGRIALEHGVTTVLPVVYFNKNKKSDK